MLMMAIRDRNPLPIPPPAKFADQTLISRTREHFNPTQKPPPSIRLAPAVIDLFAEILLDDIRQREAKNDE